MNPNRTETDRMVVIGGGPAGLTAALEAAKQGVTPLVLEKDDKVGGIARTDQYKGYHFDMGGHRFFTKNKEVQALWREIMGNEFLRRPRLSRIYYQKKFFHYPLKPFNALAGLGIVQSILIGFSYIKWQLFPFPQEETFEQWVTNRFGRRLFQIFFKSYTEKVWGIPCTELKAEWAAQRIKDLSLKTALLSMIVKPGSKITTLIEEFDYPRLGPGMMWAAFKTEIERRGGEVRLNQEVQRIERTDNRIDAVVAGTGSAEIRLTGSHFISSMPITEFINKLDPPAPAEVLHAATKLHYRDFLTVCLIINKAELFPDNWIYIHDPSVQVGRIQNFKNWSPEMVPDPTKTSLGLEYFCTEGDALWNATDADLIEQAKREVDRTGLANYADVEDGCVVRVAKAYPIYDADYGDYLGEIRTFVDAFTNCHTVGRNGLHRYNNQDHAMLTGLLATRNLLAGEQHDLWAVNVDQEYHEEVREEGVTPKPVPVPGMGPLPGWAYAKLDRVASGIATGTMAGTLLCIATLILAVKGGTVVGPTLGLLNQYFPGYEVTMAGAFIGLGYGLAAGYVGGWLFAFFRNAALFTSRALLYHRAERKVLRQLLDHF